MGSQRMRRGERRSTKARFLKAYAAHPIARHTVKALGISKSVLYKWLKTDTSFQQRYRVIWAATHECDIPRDWVHDEEDGEYWREELARYDAARRYGQRLYRQYGIDIEEIEEFMQRWKHRKRKPAPSTDTLPLQGSQQQGVAIDTIAIVPDAQFTQPAQSSAEWHLTMMQRRLSIQGQRIIPRLNAPAGVKRVRVPSGFGADGSVMWREV